MKLEKNSNEIIKNKIQTKLKINLNEIENIIHQMKLKTKLKPNSNEIEHKIQTELKMKFGLQ
jgi:hypothetical protein